MNEKFTIGEQADPVQEVRRLLTYNDFRYKEQNGTFSFRFRDRGYEWETLILCREKEVLIYGAYPFPVPEGEEVSRFLQKVNEQVLFGAMILSGKKLLFRTGADLFDSYSAYEHIGRSLEYNAGVIVNYWEQAAAVSSAS